MKTHRARRAMIAAAFAAIALAHEAHAFSLFGGAVKKPEAREFGLGPRESVDRKYTVYLKTVDEPLRPSKPQNIRVRVLDAMGRPVEGARISVDGGMPLHAHRLPAQPQVKATSGGGAYDVEGLRFSMEGWWEIELAIESPQGTDRVTFNLSL